MNQEHSWKIRCKQTSMRKVIALVFIYVNPHLAYSIEYASFCTLCIWTYDAYVSISTKGVNTFCPIQKYYENQ